MTEKYYMIYDICVSCGKPTSEGEMLCWQCLHELTEPKSNKIVLKAAGGTRLDASDNFSSHTE